ncbi:MAG: sensor protein [Frankiales bacterium]|nr:sensor protein [Frankiales bacterium]
MQMQGDNRPAGAHLVHFYESDQDQADVAARHLGPALAMGEPALVVADPAQTRRIDRALIGAGHDVAAAQRAGQFVAVTSADVIHAWVPGGRFDETAWHASAGALLRDLGGGGKQVRCYGAAVGGLWADGRTDVVAGIEAIWGTACDTDPVSMLCGYPAQLFATFRDAPALAQICHAHTEVVVSSTATTDPAGGAVDGAPDAPGGDGPSIAEALRQARMRRGWTREDLAHHSGVSYGAIAQIEAGRRTDVRLRSLVALADALDVSVDALLAR